MFLGKIIFYWTTVGITVKESKSSKATDCIITAGRGFVEYVPPTVV